MAATAGSLFASRVGLGGAQGFPELIVDAAPLVVKSYSLKGFSVSAR